MFRTLDVIMIGALIAAASWTFKVKYDSEAAHERISKLEKRLEIEKEAIDILNADWSLLTSPDRLEKLVERYHDQLQLAPVDPEMIGTLNDIPQSTDLPAAGNGEAQKYAGEGPDKRAVTGAVNKKLPAVE